MNSAKRGKGKGRIKKKTGILSCSNVESRTKLKKDGETIKKGASGTIESQRKTKKGYGRATVNFRGAGKPVEVETSKLRCV